MQAYGRLFAKVYNEGWKGFSTSFAPVIHGFLGVEGGRLLDLCCGSAHFDRYFLERGYSVTDLDLSEDMLEYARINNREFVESGKCRIVKGDAADFRLDGDFTAVVSLYDALNHLKDEDELERCFICVGNALAAGGAFIFDLNTGKGLSGWNHHDVQDEEAFTLIKQGLFVREEGIAYMKIVGFVRDDEGRYEKFREMMFNTLFDTARVAELLRQSGFRSVETRKANRAFEPAPDPESEGRVFFVARK